jgi:hypothetical protein
MLRGLLLFFALLGIISSCTKQEERIVSGNVAPPDSTLPRSLRSNFITKTYIGLIGREPNDAEFSNAKSVLDNGNYSSNARKSVVQTILNNDGIYSREFEIARGTLLNGLDTLQIRDFINTFEYLLTLPSYESLWPVIEGELNRLHPLQSSVSDMINGTCSFVEMQRRCVDNNFYDDINMGSLNYVISCFQNLLLRNPTQYESEECVRMVDGFNGILFLQVGQTKRQFQDIFFASDDYYEGQVILLYTRFLFRTPNSEEMAYYSELYKSSGDYKLVIAQILSSDEYAGLND